jgi:SAM-dependent methyltransferase
LLEQGIRTGKPTVGGFETVAADPEAALVINQAQADRSRLPAAEIARTYDFTRFTRLLDVGGGYGTVLAAILRAHPHMTGAVLDLAYHEDRARAALAAEGVGDRADFIGGSFFESVPAGFDCYLMKSIIHDWADAESQAILRNTAAAAGKGGTILIVDQVLPEIADADPANHSAFRTDITMLLGTGGRERTEAEFGALLKSAGLTLQRIVANDSEFRVIEATVD